MALGVRTERCDGTGLATAGGADAVKRQARDLNMSHTNVAAMARGNAGYLARLGGSQLNDIPDLQQPLPKEAVTARNQGDFGADWYNWTFVHTPIVMRTHGG